MAAIDMERAKPVKVTIQQPKKGAAGMPESRRKALILWEMFGRPLGDDGIRILQQAIEQSTDEQIRETLRHIARQ